MKPPFPKGTIHNFFPESPNFIYSNFYPRSVTFEGITYPDNEHAYQAAKSLDNDVRQTVLRCGSAIAAKSLGGTIKLREGWDQIKFSIMAELINQKFSVGSDLAIQLLSTGDVELIEGNYWHDLVWGQCSCIRHNWDGSNRLGGILMERRLQLRNLG